MFYRLDVEPNVECGHVEKVAGSAFYPFMFINGRVLAGSMLPALCHFSVRGQPDVPLVIGDYYPDVHLMSKRLVGVIQAAGADNLQIVPAEIQPIHGGPVITDHAVVNVVGMVACSIPSSSDSTPLTDGQYFFKLAIEPARASGLQIFRLAESKIDVIVSERLATAIRSEGFPTLRLEPVVEGS